MTASKWLTWQPRARINEDSSKMAPTKPSKPGSVGFEGAVLGDSRVIRPHPKGDAAAPCPDAAKKEAITAPVEERISGHDETLQSALQLLNERGCRLMDISGQRVIGCWPELDDRDFREALKLIKMDHLQVAWLDNPAIPAKYRTCRPKVQRLRKARKPMSWESWILSRPKGWFSPHGGGGLVTRKHA